MYISMFKNLIFLRVRVCVVQNLLLCFRFSLEVNRWAASENSIITITISVICELFVKFFSPFLHWYTLHIQKPTCVCALLVMSGIYPWRQHFVLNHENYFFHLWNRSTFISDVNQEVCFYVNQHSFWFACYIN